uniref:Golgin A4 n=1 Tax=Myripristis murdjan TaxID=586833 RepID=A0A667XDJ8_9TELE
MFKKLKQKINEEQSPQRNAQSPQQAQVGCCASASKGVTRSPRGSVNGDASASPQRDEHQSFAQKLQLKVPSVESLLRGGASRAENLFRSSSRESLVRSPSRESLTPFGENESVATPTYDPPSDIESEAEESPGNAEAMSKDQLLHRLHRVERSLGNYRGKYSELVTAYRTVQRDKEKTQAILSQSQDKALRRIGELREELQMDQQAKKHLQDEFDAALEEKDQMITVLQTQVALLKKRVKGVSDGAVPPENEASQSADAVDSASAPQSPSKEPEVEPGPTEVMEALQKRVKRQENLLQKCKDLLRTHKERSAQLSSENETLQEQLQERLQELEKMKELHTTEKTKLITQLRDAKNLIEQLEQDKGMVIAETKRQMHETLEMKEEEIAQLRSRLQQASAQRDDLQEQKEKSEKSAFEELEKALGVAQRAEEARKQLQVQLEEQVKEVERASEEERKSLQQELTRVKQEVVTIMKVRNCLSSQHSLSICLHFKQEIFCINSKEHEQQTALALEDAELQKTALKVEADNKVKEIQLELEAARTRVLELESSLKKSCEDGSSLSHEFSSQLDELKAKHTEQISALEEKHREQLEKHKDTLTQQHNAGLEEVKEKHKVEVETILKNKELQFHEHIEDMNQKTLEKLTTKETEIEALSIELSEALKSKQLLEERLTAAEDADSVAQQELEQRLQDQVAKHNAEIANIKQEHEQSLGGMEKTLKEELNTLKIVLKEKEKEFEEHMHREKTLKEELDSVLQDLNIKAKELEGLHQSLLQAQSENESLKESGAELSKITADFAQCKSDLKDLESQLQVTKTDCKDKEETLQQRMKELKEQEQQLQQAKKELSEQDKSYSEKLNAKQEEEERLKKRLDAETAAHEKKVANIVKEMEGKLKAQETKMDKLKQKAKEMQEKFKKKLQETEECMKKELAKKETELQQKEQQVQEKILEMAQKSSQGLSSAMSELQANHKEELEKLHDTHKNEIKEIERRWQEKLGQQEEDITERHSHTLQEKAQELEEISQQLSRSREESDKVLHEIKDLKEELAIRETTVQKLQAELREAAVKLESLSQGEVLLKEQMESVERNLNQALNERNSLQDQLSLTEEESKERVKALSDKLEETEKQLRALEASTHQEGEDLQKKIEESSTQLQAKEAEFQKHLITISNQMERYCKEIQSKLDCGSNELSERVECRVRELKDRVLCNQKKVGHLKNTILTKIDRICTLEKNLQQQMEENKNLCISLEQMTAQVNAHSEHIEALTSERESLRRTVENHSQSISEKVSRIEELGEENKTISENAKTQDLHISNLESIINDLKTQLAGSKMEKEEAITLLNQQYKEERQQVVAQMEEAIERLEQERKSAVEQAETLRNSLSELENTAESNLTQNHNTVISLQTRLEDMEREISAKNEALERLTASIDNQSISKSEMDQALSEKEQRVSALTLELESCNGRLVELQEQLALKTKECEQLTADLKQQLSIRENEKREFTEQLQQTQAQFTQNGNLDQETVEKLHTLEKENQICKLELESQKEEFEKIKNEILKSKEESLKAAEEKLSTESAKKVSELKKRAEQKIGQIKKQLTSQLEEKEQTVKALQTSLQEIKRDEASTKQHIETLEERGRKLEEAIVKLQEQQEKQLEEVQSNERLAKEKSLEELKNMYEEKLSSHQRDATNQEEPKAVETESTLQEVKAMLKEAEEQNGILVAEISRLKEKLLEKDAQLDQQQATVSYLEKEGQNPIEPEVAVKLEHSSLTQEVDSDSHESLKNKLTEVKNEKQRIQKDFTRLQKDIRSLRKEHEQDLEYMKKELSEEYEKKLKVELEDMEMKHNSGLKQLMREFNTQMVLKERELDSAVKEAIGKAQSVEAELISSHREETIQLQKMVAQKEDDLHRTVQKYEQVLQTREEEMGDRVWQVQKELEELQARSLFMLCPAHPSLLQAQLAEKTTLLSEMRLKEQEFVDRIHSLEDKIRCFHKNSVVTHLGNPGYNSGDALSEPTEFEYLRKVLFEYMMGRETKTMAKVITSMLKFPPDQAQKVLDKEDSKAIPWLR